MKNFLTSFLVFSASVVLAQLKPYCVQMHIHGMSNHNGNQYPGSMQYHSFHADSTKLDVLWWSEHMHAYHQHATAEYTFNGGVWNPGLSEITNLNPPDASLPKKWIVDKYIGTGTYTVSVNDSTLNLIINSDNSGSSCFLEAYPRGKDDLLQGTRTFIRTLFSTPVLEFDLFASGLNGNPDRKVQYIIYLNYHVVNKKNKLQKIVYNFVDANTTAYSISTVDSVTVTVNQPVNNNAWNHLVLNLANDASYLFDGEDNCIMDYHPRVEAANNASVTGMFANMTMYSLNPSHNNQWQKLNAYADMYEVRYPRVEQMIGSEFSFDYLNNSKTHFNAFVPDTLTNNGFMHDSSIYSMTAQQYITMVKINGGVVSYNHPFGAGRYTLGTQQFQDSLTDATALYMLSTNAFGADLLEVGYLQRGDCDLAHHIKLWDKLTANGLFLYGNAVGDRHGGIWYSNDNNLSTWVQSEDSSSIKLLKHIKKGHMFFGNNFQWTGNMNMRVANAEMGDRIVLQGTLAAPLDFVMTNPLPGTVYKYTQALLKTGLNVTYLAQDVIFNPQHPPVLDLSKSCFVRVVAYNTNGEAYACSNPIVLFSGNFTPWDNSPLSMLPDPSELRVSPTLDQHVKTVTINSAVAQSVSISLFDTQGRLVKKYRNYDVNEGLNYIDIDMHALAPAIYIVNVDGRHFRAATKVALSNVELVNTCSH